MIRFRSGEFPEHTVCVRHNHVEGLIEETAHVLICTAGGQRYAVKESLDQVLEKLGLRTVTAVVADNISNPRKAP